MKFKRFISQILKRVRFSSNSIKVNGLLIRDFVCWGVLLEVVELWISAEVDDRNV